jgi:HEAT repeat protein
VLLALRDQDPRIRRAAVLAFGNLDYAASGSQSIGASTLRELAAVYERESDGAIRSEIVKAFALSPSDSPVLRQLLRSAFDDLEPGVRQYAAVGASRLKSPELLPQLVRQLNESAVSARLVASGAIAHYGAVALPFLGAIMDAQAQESDPSVKRSLAAAVRAVKAGEKE